MKKSTIKFEGKTMVLLEKDGRKFAMSGSDELLKKWFTVIGGMQPEEKSSFTIEICPFGGEVFGYEYSEILPELVGLIIAENERLASSSDIWYKSCMTERNTSEEQKATIEKLEAKIKEYESVILKMVCKLFK